jgi:hypothetical protein
MGISPWPSERLLRAVPWVKEPRFYLLSPRAGAGTLCASTGRFIEIPPWQLTITGAFLTLEGGGGRTIIFLFLV